MTVRLCAWLNRFGYDGSPTRRAGRESLGAKEAITTRIFSGARSPTAKRLLSVALVLAGAWSAWFCWRLAPGQLDETGLAGREREPLRWAMWATYATSLAWVASAGVAVAGRRLLAVIAEAVLFIATMVLIGLSF